MAISNCVSGYSGDYIILLIKCFQVHEKYACHEEEWRYELRVRYIPTDLKDLFEKDKVTFYYYYDQVSRSNLKLRYVERKLIQRMLINA